MTDIIMISPADIMVLLLIGWRRGDGYDQALECEGVIDVPILGLGCTHIRRDNMGHWTMSSGGTLSSAR